MFFLTYIPSNSCNMSLQLLEAVPSLYIPHSQGGVSRSTHHCQERRGRGGEEREGGRGREKEGGREERRGEGRREGGEERRGRGERRGREGGDREVA